MDSLGASIELPKYRSHKEVHALKIMLFEKKDGALGGRITPEDVRYAPFEVDESYVTKHDPKAGGYYVVYDDGYKSWSPAQTFESGYSRI